MQKASFIHSIENVVWTIAAVLARREYVKFSIPMWPVYTK